MNNHGCLSCCSSHGFIYRDIQHCFCDIYPYRHMPNPVKTRPFVLKLPAVPMAIPRSLRTVDARREDATNDKEKTTVLKFGIDAILGIKPTGSKPFLTAKDDSATNVFSHTNQLKTLRVIKGMPPKRAVFTDHQRRQLELEFLAHKYISKQERRNLANRLHLSESQVRIWFQNRRMKWRNRQEREMMRRQRMNSMK